MNNILFFLTLNLILIKICKNKEKEKNKMEKEDYMDYKSKYLFEKNYINRDKKNTSLKRVLEDKKHKNNFIYKRNMNEISDTISNSITDTSSNIILESSTNIYSEISDSFSNSISDSNIINEKFSDNNENILSEITSFDINQETSEEENELSEELIDFIPTEEENEIEPTSSKLIDNELPPDIQTLTNTIFLVQVCLNEDNNLEIYIISDALIPQNVLFNVTMNYYLPNNDQGEDNTISVNTYFTFEKVQSEDNKERLICYTSNEEEEDFRFLIEYYEGIKFTVTNLQRDYVDYSNVTENYDFIIYLLNNTNTDKKEKYNYLDTNVKVRMYKIKKISSCTNDCEFNLTLNKKYDGKDMNMIIEFETNNTEKNSKKIINNYADCFFSLEGGKNIFCQLEEEFEGLPIEYKCNGYIYNDKNEIYAVYLDYSNQTNVLICKSIPPYFAYIFIGIYFIFIIVIVLIIIILMNSKGKENENIINQNEKLVKVYN